MKTCVALLLLFAACSKDHSGDSVTVGPRVHEGQVAPRAVRATSGEVQKSLVPMLDAGGPIFRAAAPAPTAVAPRPDPNQEVIASAREAGAHCFGGPSPSGGRRTATLVVTVVPTGDVTRSEVTGTSDTSVVDCLKGIGDSLRFSPIDETAGDAGPPSASNLGGDLRTFSIDVTVVWKH